MRPPAGPESRAWLALIRLLEKPPSLRITRSLGGLSNSMIKFEK